MSHVRIIAIALGSAFALPAFAAAATSLAGTWKSEPEDTSLTTEFDESVWGRNAKSVRTVEIVVRPDVDATLRVTRKVVDARGRTVKGSPSVDSARLKIGGPVRTAGPRTELDVSVASAERSYPDDPGARWPLDGLRVGITSLTDDPGTLEIRIDTPEGRGSFWETVRRTARAAAPSQSASPSTTP